MTVSSYDPATDEGWRKDAACHSTGGPLPQLHLVWITEGLPEGDTARRVCRELCPVREQCLTEAVFDPKSFGIRGGYFFKDGKLTKRESRQLRAETGIDVPTRQQSRKTA